MTRAAMLFATAAAVSECGSSPEPVYGPSPLLDASTHDATDQTDAPPVFGDGAVPVTDAAIGDATEDHDAEIVIEYGPAPGFGPAPTNERG